MMSGMKILLVVAEAGKIPYSPQTLLAGQEGLNHIARL
jgi:hypothetical protein